MSDWSKPSVRCAPSGSDTNRDAQWAQATCALTRYKSLWGTQTCCGLPPRSKHWNKLSLRASSGAALRDGIARHRLVQADAAVWTSVCRPLFPARRRKAASAVSKHPANVSSASWTWKSPRKGCPGDQRDRSDAHRQVTRVRFKRHQRRQSEAKEGDRNQDHIRPQHAPPEPLSDRLDHAHSRPRVRFIHGAQCNAVPREMVLICVS